MQLILNPDDSQAEIAGTLRLRIGAGILRDFRLRLVYKQLADGSVNAFEPPDIYETGGRLPRGDADRHIESDGRFCMWLPFAAPRDFDGPHGLALHLHRVQQFLRMQLIYEDRKARGLTPAWPGPEWKHGLDGYRQWVQEHVAGIDQESLRRLVTAVLRAHYKRQAIHPACPCPCRSGRIWRSCHSPWARPVLKALKDVHAATVIRELLALVEDKVDQVADIPADTRSTSSGGLPQDLPEADPA